MIFNGMEIHLVQIIILLRRKNSISPINQQWAWLSIWIATNFRTLKTCASLLDRNWGPLIWAHRSRPDVGFLITKIANDLATARAGSSKAIQLAKLYNQTVRYLQNRPVEIHYVHLPDSQLLSH